MGQCQTRPHNDTRRAPREALNAPGTANKTVRPPPSFFGFGFGSGSTVSHAHYRPAFEVQCLARCRRRRGSSVIPIWVSHIYRYQFSYIGISSAGTVAFGDRRACGIVDGDRIIQIASWSSSNAVANPKGVPPVWLTSLAGVAAEIYSVAVSTETATPAIPRMGPMSLS